ncbi:hypothetical protein [Streptomyces antimycoticus]|uniref:hypothetical protein n=1 Tax=Streptomyces antimycoticus TaxID=68175 RepID=UPI0036864456
MGGARAVDEPEQLVQAEQKDVRRVGQHPAPVQVRAGRRDPPLAVAEDFAAHVPAGFPVVQVGAQPVEQEQQQPARAP